MVVQVPGRTGGIPWSDTDITLTPRGLILRRWWDAFRLVLLLAIGPALLATAWATARENPRFIAKTVIGPAGTPVLTYVPADDGIHRVGELRLGGRLINAALLIVTVLLHGAATASLGLAVATAIGRARLALTVTIGLSLFLILGVPLGLFVKDLSYSQIYNIWGFVMIADSLLFGIMLRLSGDIVTMRQWLLVWNVVVLVVSVGLLWFTVRVWQRRFLSLSKGQVAPELGSEAKPPDVSAVLLVD